MHVTKLILGLPQRVGATALPNGAEGVMRDLTMIYIDSRRAEALTARSNSWKIFREPVSGLGADTARLPVMRGYSRTRTHDHKRYGTDADVRSAHRREAGQE
jgi:hypothetical protein